MEVHVSHLQISPPALLILLATIASALLLYLRRRLSLRADRYPLGARSPIAETDVKNQRDRTPGEWHPIPPHIYSFPSADIHPTARGDVPQITPIQYRPFKWGPKYHITMGLKSLAHGEWFELDNEYATYQRIRRGRINSKGRELLRIIPSDKVGDGAVVRGTRIAQGAVELLLATAEYLAQRYPESFTLDSATRTITNRVLDETHNLPPSIWADEKVGVLREVFLEEGEAALRTCALLIPDDLALLTEGADGKYYLQGGAILVPGTWRLREKLGMKLEDIHVEGKVPRYEQALRPSMDRYFARLAVDKPVVRVNYGVQVLPSQPSGGDPIDDPDELAWAAATMGEEFPHEDTSKISHDEAANTSHNGTPNAGHDAPNADLRRHARTADVRPERLRLRVERQTLRRLPGTGIIVFGIRTYRYLISDIKHEMDGGTTTAAYGNDNFIAPAKGEKDESATPDKENESVGARLASALRSWPDDVRRYKGGHTWGDTVIEYLEAKSS